MAKRRIDSEVLPKLDGRMIERLILASLLGVSGFGTSVSHDIPERLASIETVLNRTQQDVNDIQRDIRLLLMSGHLEHTMRKTDEPKFVRE